jgi:hypothetical protein
MSITRPKLLLDANVFRSLASRELAQHEARLLRVAGHREPPLLWVAPVTFDELLCHVRVEEAADFSHFREAFSWMDRLCGNGGMAEDILWVVLRRALVAVPPYDGQISVLLNWLRRKLIKTQSFEDLDAELLGAIEAERANYTQRLNAWLARRRTIHDKARVPPKAGEPRLEGKKMVVGALLELTRTQAEPYAAAWGPLRPEAELKHEMREVIAFALAFLNNSRNRDGYNVEKNDDDYNDGWLLEYLPAGYTLVTGDRRLHGTVVNGGCRDPRIVDVAGALDIAEAVLAGEQ